MDIGRKISELRQKKELTQREFAEQIGVSSGAVGMWETGKRQPDLDTIGVLADFFNVTVDYLLGREDDSSDLAVPREETEELLRYYAALDKMEQRWVMGQMVDLLRQKEAESVAADSSSSLKEVK